MEQTRTNKMKKTLGEKINQLATIVKTKTACIGNMSWETPVYTFELEDKRLVEWCTEDESFLDRKGAVVHLDCFYYEKKGSIRRVTITELEDKVRIILSKFNSV